MSNKKKRNKHYKGSTAAVRPTVMKVSAVKRTRIHQWWIDHEQIAKPVLAVAAVALLIIVIIVGIIGIIWR